MKKIYVKTYGIFLNGREEGERAFDILKQDLQKLKNNEKVFFDFSDVIVLAPSWCDEFFGEAAIQYPGKTIIDQSIHEGLKKSFEVVSDARNVSFTFGDFHEDQ